MQNKQVRDLMVSPNIMEFHETIDNQPIITTYIMEFHIVIMDLSVKFNHFDQKVTQTSWFRSELPLITDNYITLINGIHFTDLHGNLLCIMGKF